MVLAYIVSKIKQLMCKKIIAFNFKILYEDQLKWNYKDGVIIIYIIK